MLKKISNPYNGAEVTHVHRADTMSAAGFTALLARAAKFLPQDRSGFEDFACTMESTPSSRPRTFYGEFFHVEDHPDGVLVTELDDWPGGEIEYLLSAEDFLRIPAAVKALGEAE
jgi:hypothetical protein